MQRLFTGKGKVIIIIIVLCAITLAAYSFSDTRHEVKELLFNTIGYINPSVPVLLYHHLSKPGEGNIINNNIVLNVDDFENQMKVLYDNRFTSITTSDLYEFIKNKKELPRKSVLITFDDGYESNYIYAYPILKKYGFRATIFIITSKIKDKIEPTNFDQLQYLSREEMQKSSDVFEYGSHSDNLHNLINPQSSTFVNEPLERVEKDVTKSKGFINTSAIAYPYGFYNNDIIHMLKNVGFTIAFTTAAGRAYKNTDLFKVPRYEIFSNTPINIFENMIGAYDKAR